MTLAVLLQQSASLGVDFSKHVCDLGIVTFRRNVTVVDPQGQVTLAPFSIREIRCKLVC